MLSTTIDAEPREPGNVLIMVCRGSSPPADVPIAINFFGRSFPTFSILENP